jgi:2-oxoglutarate dehydrogenase E1 component
LRRQMIRNFRKPLVVMTPKSLLRHKLAVSPLSDLHDGKFHTVIPEIDALDASKVSKIVICCGKVYYDLLEERRERGLSQVAIIRIEQLYPFPKKALMAEFDKFSQATEIVWCQEEPQNQGAWFSSQHNFQECLQGRTLRYAGRGFAASPAVGSPAYHVEQQKALVAEALGL